MIHALFFTFSKKSQNWAIHVLFLKKKRERWPVCIIPLWIHWSLLCFNVLVDARVFVAYVLYNVLLTYNTNLGTLNVRMVSIPCQNTVFLLLLQFASFSRIFLCSFLFMSGYQIPVLLFSDCFTVWYQCISGCNDTSQRLTWFSDRRSFLTVDCEKNNSLEITKSWFDINFVDYYESVQLLALWMCEYFNSNCTNIQLLRNQTVS